MSTDRFHGLEALPGQPDASVLLVGYDEQGEAQALFPQMVVIGVEGTPKPHAALSGRTLYVWCEREQTLAAQLSEVSPNIGIVQGHKSAFNFRNDAGKALAYVKDNIKRYERPVIEVTVVREVPRETVEEAALSDIDEQSLASEFSRRNPNLRYVAPWGRWFEWNGHKWQQDDTLRVFDLARMVCRDSAPVAGSAPLMRKVKSAATRAAVVNLAQSDRIHAATIDQWDRDLWMLNTPGGMVNLRDGTVRPGRIDDYATKSTSVTAAGDCPQWREFLRQICDFDDDLVGFLQRMIGYSLTGETREQCLFFCYGTGANGKGTFINTLRDIMGDYAMVAGMDVFTDSKHDRHPQELARLRGARMVCAQETDEGKRWAEARLKALTGGDPITAHFMRQDDFEFMPQFKLIIAGNHKPQLRNIDEAMRRRLHLVPFTVTIPPDKRDKELGAKLKREASGILQWAIDGCIEWQKFGLQPPEAVLAATAEYLNSQDVFGSWVDECTDRSTDKTRTSDLYKSYKSWSEERNEYAIAQRRFVEMLESRGHSVCKLHGLSMAAGISLKNSLLVCDF